MIPGFDIVCKQSNQIIYDMSNSESPTSYKYNITKLSIIPRIQKI